MARYKIHNKSDKPNNVVRRENDIYEKCQEIENELPRFLRDFFLYLKGDVLPMTRLAYLGDIKFFLDYLIDIEDFTTAREAKNITISDLKKVRANDVNLFIDYCRRYEVFDEKNGEKVIFENRSKSLARKKSSISVLFKYLYRSEMLEKNITDGFNPIRVPKAAEREVKALTDDEALAMLEAVTTGEGLTDHEKFYWKKTKLRDRLILMLFLTYGLRLSELQQLNISSFNMQRGEFKIYRKRGKEAIMPINESVGQALDEYLEMERPTYELADESQEDALFLSLQGRRMTDRQIRQLVKKYTSIAMHTSRNAGYSPHKLRATAATSLIGRGNSIYDVAALLDHEQVTTTQLYARHKENVKRNLVEDMEWQRDLKKEQNR